jgi:hypothetical protein
MPERVYQESALFAKATVLHGVARGPRHTAAEASGANSHLRSDVLRLLAFGA